MLEVVANGAIILSSGVAPSKCYKYTLYRWACSFLLAFVLCIVVPSSPTSMEHVCPPKGPSGRVRIRPAALGQGSRVVGRDFSEPNPHFATRLLPDRGGPSRGICWVARNLWPNSDGPCPRAAVIRTVEQRMVMCLPFVRRRSVDSAPGGGTHTILPFSSTVPDNRPRCVGGGPWTPATIP